MDIISLCTREDDLVGEGAQIFFIVPEEKCDSF